jgi:hypothetical protein
MEIGNNVEVEGKGVIMDNSIELEEPVPTD